LARAFRPGQGLRESPSPGALKSPTESAEAKLKKRSDTRNPIFRIERYLKTKKTIVFE
jgi:hypothetical protein